jgi:PadR family transcriptional regulator, regulatory protein PadR
VYAPPLDGLEERWMTRSAALVQGTLDMLILKTLALEPMHGYGVGIRIEQISAGVFTVNAGSLFPALHKLERSGLLNSEWRQTENGRRAKYYHLSANGRTKLTAAQRDWQAQTAAISRILKTNPEEI